jgi:hypothetical protein
MLQVARLIIDSGKLFTLPPLLLVFIKYRHLKKEMKAVACFVFLATVVQFAASYLASFKSNNLPLLHLYTPLEFCCIVWFYSMALEGFVPKPVFVGAAVGFTVMAVLNAVFLQSIYEFNTYARSLEGVLVILLCLTWCWRVLTEMKIQRLEQNPVFWANTGFLIYFSGNVLLFAFSNFILDYDKSLNLYVWAFHGLLSGLLYLLISIGLWKVPAQQMSS